MIINELPPKYVSLQTQLTCMKETGWRATKGSYTSNKTRVNCINGTYGREIDKFDPRFFHYIVGPHGFCLLQGTSFCLA